VSIETALQQLWLMLCTEIEVIAQLCSQQQRHAEHKCLHKQALAQQQQQHEQYMSSCTSHEIRFRGKLFERLRSHK
jgi:hypothetical protein